MPNPFTLSLQDLAPIAQGTSTQQAMAETVLLAREADRLGYTRLWYAEHHGMPSIASSVPEILIASAAAATTGIRVGSGGVMLPNHAPLIVAEQFAALEALAPGRIDLGLGRAPGSDPVITQLLRSSGAAGDVERFPQHMQDIALMLQPDGATVQFTTGGQYQVRSTPSATGTPQIWILGSSDYSAQLAAAHGLPYVFANHFSGHGLERALDLYRSGFQPSETLAEPRTFLTANVVADDTAEEADDRALPQLRMMARLQQNKPLTALQTVEQAKAGLTTEADPAEQSLIAAMRQRWFIGDGSSVASDLSAFAARHGVDEIMLSPVAGAYDAEPLDETPGRIRTLELLAR